MCIGFFLVSIERFIGGKVFYAILFSKAKKGVIDMILLPNTMPV
jgi:hypothetical protein